MPFAFIDMDLFNENIRQILQRTGDKKIRVASQAIRCTHILKYILNSNPLFEGVMCYTAQEAVYLSQQGFNNLLIGYPTLQKQDLEAICEELKKGKEIILTIDSPGHLHRLNKIAASFELKVPVCVEIDMSTDFSRTHFGAWRSTIRTVEDMLSLLAEARPLTHIQIVALMGYEAQLAEIADTYQGQMLKARSIRNMKKRSIPMIHQRRQAIASYLEETNIDLKFVNGGGTGSLESTIKDHSVTELTIGSAFFSPALFDNFDHFKHLPATAFAVQIVRRPKKGVYACLGGGYIASGPTSMDKSPVIYLPKGAILTPEEGAGEIQTPIIYHGEERLALGDPVFMRHSKSGELCEHFNELYLVSEGKVVDKVQTYRGEGKCFL